MLGPDELYLHDSRLTDRKASQPMSGRHDARPGPFGPVPAELPENRDALDTILTHVSVRRFNEKPLPDETVAILHEAIRRAPTSSAMQSTLYVTITDRELLKQVRPHVGGQEFVEMCGAFIVGCMDLRHLDRVTTERGYPNRSSDFRLLITSLEDVSISVQNAAVAAESLELGTVMVGGTIDGASELVRLLKLPDRVVPLLGLAVGWPAQEPMPLKPRLPRPVVFHHNQYSATSADEMALLDEHDQEIIQRQYYRNRHISWDELGTPGSDGVTPEAYGWQEHAARKQARTWWDSATPKLIQDLQALGWQPLDLLKLWKTADV